MMKMTCKEENTLTKLIADKWKPKRTNSASLIAVKGLNCQGKKRAKSAKDPKSKGLSGKISLKIKLKTRCIISGIWRIIM